MLANHQNQLLLLETSHVHSFSLPTFFLLRKVNETSIIVGVHSFSLHTFFLLRNVHETSLLLCAPGINFYTECFYTNLDLCIFFFQLKMSSLLHALCSPDTWKPFFEQIFVFCLTNFRLFFLKCREIAFAVTGAHNYRGSIVKQF